MEGRMEGRKEGRKEGREGGRKGGREEGRNEGRKEGKKEGRKNIRRIEKQHILDITDTLERFDCLASHITLEMVKEKSNLHGCTVHQ